MKVAHRQSQRPAQPGAFWLAEPPVTNPSIRESIGTFKRLSQSALLRRVVIRFPRARRCHRLVPGAKAEHCVFRVALLAP